MHPFLIASMLSAAVAASPPNKLVLFENFIAKYDRQYATEFEKGKRFQIFSHSIDEIYASNAKNRSYTLGVTAHTDLTFEEWQAGHLNGFKPMLTATKEDRPIFQAPAAFAEPDSVDWVNKGGVTEVKSQGTCGSCWTFAAAGALEGAMFISGKKMVDLSMQHILACDKVGDGCQGGTVRQALDWVSENGIPALTDEPYLCKDALSSQCKSMTCGCNRKTGFPCSKPGPCNTVNGSVCDFDPFDGSDPYCECPADQCFNAAEGTCGSSKPETMVLAVGDVSEVTLVNASENALEAAVAQQPVSVGISVGTVVRHYTSGVLTRDLCDDHVSHGVLAVGYGVDNGLQYWKLKNSWGTDFGEDGYIRIEKVKAWEVGECGIRKMASFPTVKSSSSIVV